MEFYTQKSTPDWGVAEDMLMDPLILASPKVVPLVIREIQNKDMPRRGYAILFLGVKKHREALPVLRQILEDEEEYMSDRVEALVAINSIDKLAAEDYLIEYQE